MFRTNSSKTSLKKNVNASNHYHQSHRYNVQTIKKVRIILTTRTNNTLHDIYLDYSYSTQFNGIIIIILIVAQGRTYNVGEKPTVILYTLHQINRHDMQVMYTKTEVKAHDEPG